MTKNPSETLAFLFKIEPQVIENDIRRAQENIRSITDEIALVKAVPFHERTPEMEARRAHLFMIQTHELCRRDTVAPEVQTFYASLGAGYIAQDAEMVAANRDTCAELSKQMDDIRRREGFAPDECWVMRWEGPQDYRDLSEQFCRVLDGITDTIFVFALRRYHLDDQADLFEKDRVTFDIQREIGRRVIRPLLENEADVEDMIDDGFRRKYGSSAFKRVLDRAQEISDTLRE